VRRASARDTALGVASLVRAVAFVARREQLAAFAALAAAEDCPTDAAVEGEAEDRSTVERAGAGVHGGTFGIRRRAGAAARATRCPTRAGAAISRWLAHARRGPVGGATVCRNLARSVVAERLTVAAVVTRLGTDTANAAERAAITIGVAVFEPMRVAVGTGRLRASAARRDER
jgi:hypothetical protein